MGNTLGKDTSVSEEEHQYQEQEECQRREDRCLRHGHDLSSAGTGTVTNEDDDSYHSSSLAPRSNEFCATSPKRRRNEEEEETHQQAGVPSDSWKCSVCTRDNDPGSETCATCETVPIEERSEEPLRGEEYVTKVFWKCSTCTFDNDTDTNKCAQCETSRNKKRKAPKERSPVQDVPVDTPEGSWECSSCTLRNDTGDVKCVACQTPQRYDGGQGATAQHSRASATPNHFKEPSTQTDRLEQLRRERRRRRLSFQSPQLQELWQRLHHTGEPTKRYPDIVSSTNPSSVSRIETTRYDQPGRPHFNERDVTHSWNCSLCTFANEVDNERCAMCGTASSKTL